MNEDLKILFDQYKAVNPAITEEMFQNSLDSFGEQYITDVTEVVKKKDPTSGNQNLTTQNPPQTDLPTLPNIIPENEFTVPLGSEQDLSSASSDTTVEIPSTDLPLTDVASSGTESSPTNQPLSGITTPTLDDAGNIPMPTNPIQNPMVKNMGAQLNVNNLNLANIDAFYEANKTKLAQNGKRATLTFEGTNEDPLDVLGGKNNDIQGEITMTPSSPEELAADAKKRDQEAQAQIANQENQSNAFINQYVNKDYVNANPIVNKQPFNSWGVADNTETEDNLLLLESKGLIQVQRDADGAPIYEDNKYRYKITDKDYYDNTYTPYIENLQREAEKQAREQNVDSARFNFGNVGNNPEQDAFGEFMSKASKFGVIPTTEEYEALTTEAARNEYLASLEATQNAQKNKTTFQEEYDKVIGSYNLTDEVKFANGFDAVNLLNQGIENGNYKDNAEIDYFTKFFGDRNNVMDFGEYWEREGKAIYKSSLVRENQANYQQTRADIWNDYLSYKNDKLGVNNRFLEEAVVTSSAKADKYALAGNTVALEQERAKMENLYSQYEANEAKMYEISEIFRESNKNFTSVAKKRKEQEEFEIKVQNGEVGANVKNILGQIPLALGTSINSTLSGIGRIVSSVIPSDNLKDALDVMSDTELKVGNIKVASLTDKIKTFKGSDGFNYKEINGKTYGVKDDGTIFKTTYQQNGSETNVKEEIDYNGSGMVFLTSKMISDIYLTTGVGKGLNTFIGSSANRIANSKKIASVFGEGSHLAKTSASFAKLAKNADNVSVTGWYVQMYNDSYKMAEQGGITDPVNKHLYAVAMSFTQSIIQRINPDTNFLKPLNTNVRQIARALINENPANAKQAVAKFLKETADASIQYAKKAGNNVPKEVLEEVIQQGTQDVSNLALNGITGTNFQTSSAQDYEELVVGTIVPSAVASLLGGKGSRLATINNKEIDLTTYSRNELITELARDPKGLDLIKDFKEGAFFQSQKDSAQKIEDEINTRKKYISKVPEAEKYTSSSISDVAPILQKIDEKKELLKKDDGTFAERINKDIADLTAQANAILDNDLTPNTENAETPQPTPQPETTQEQTNTTDTEPEQTAVQPTPQPIIPGGNGGAESGVTLNTEPNGQTTPEIQSPTSQTQEDGQTSQAEGRDTTNQLPEMGEGNTKPEEPTQEVAPQEEVNEYDIDLDAIFAQLEENEKAQTDNSGTDGNTESGTDSLQQSEQTGETNQQEVPATANTGASEGNAEIKKTYSINDLKDDEYNNLPKNVVEQFIDLDNQVSNLNLYDENDIKKGEELRARISKLRSENGLDDLILNHGTPHDFEKFVTDKIGTGEGNQAFGWGLYFAENKKIAKNYAKVLDKDKNGIVYTVKIKDGKNKKFVEWRDFIEGDEIESIASKFTPEDTKKYDDYLAKIDYSDTKDHTGLFKDVLDEIKDGRYGYGDLGYVAFGNAYNDLSDALGQDRASALIKDAGYSGIKYKSNKGKGKAFNYVIFDANDVVISSKERLDGTVVQQTETENQQTWSEEIIPTSNPALSVKKSTNPNTGASTFEFIDTKSGKPKKVGDNTQKKYLTEIVKNTTYSETEIPEGVQNPNDLNQVILQDSKNPVEIANILMTIPKYQFDKGSKEYHIANNITRVSRQSFINHSDKNNITMGLAQAYFAKKGTETNEMNIDRIAFNASSDFAGGEYGNDEITVGDVVKFILEYRSGADSFFKQPNPDYQSAVNRFVALTGMNPSQKVLKDILGLNTENIEVEERAKVYAENQVDKLSNEQQNNLANQYDQWFNSLTLQEQTAELQNTYPYEDITRNQQPEVEKQSKPADSKRQISTDAPNESTAKQGEKANQKTNTSPEYQQLLKDREAQEARVKSTKENLDRVSKNTNKDFQADQVNLFEERQAQEGMFDERADGNAAKEIIANAKREYDQAKADLSKTNKAIRDFESGNASGTGAIDFDSETTNTPSYGSENKIISTDRYEELKKQLKAKLNNLNSGFDPEMLSIGTQMAMYHIESGSYTFGRFAKAMINDLGDKIKPYLKSFYEGAKYMPGMEELSLKMDSSDIVSSTNLDNINIEGNDVTLNNETTKTTGNEKSGRELQPTRRTLQGNSKRVHKRKSQRSVQKSFADRTQRDSGKEGENISGADDKINQSTDGEGGLLPGYADVLINEINEAAEQEPALVEFNLEDQNSAKFSTTKKLGENIDALKTLVSILKEKRNSTAEEKVILSKYAGFGGLKEILNNPDKDSDWRNKTHQSQVKQIVGLTKELDELLETKDTLADLRAGTINAHFTPAQVIESVYKGIWQLGFKGGNVLEPSAGIGNFIGFMPKKMSGKSKFTAVELDQITGNILKQIYTGADVKISGLESANIPNNSQDLVVSNIPFGNYGVFDRAFKGDRAALTKTIHGYFFAKAIDQAREGGIIAFVTTKGVLDSKGNEGLRKHLNDNTNFLGAVRLPNTTFSNSANTAVVTDIIFLQKNTVGERNNVDFVGTSPMEIENEEGNTEVINLNNYFLDNPQNILGSIESGGLYSKRGDYTVNGNIDNLTQRIQEMLPKDIVKNVPSEIGSQANDNTEQIDNIKEGNIAIINGKVVRKTGGEINEVTMPSYIKNETVEQYIELRDTLNELIYSEYLGKNDKELNIQRAKLNRLYDAVHRGTKASKKEFYRVAKEDNDGFNVQALTKSDESKADIFSKRTIQPIQQKTSASNIDEAIVISLYENAAIDIERVAELMGTSVHEVKQQAKGKIFEEPTGGFVTRDEYLSGNVKEKLKLAKEAVDNGFIEFQNNVDELLLVIPQDIPATLIESRLGSRWIPTEIFEDFGKFMLNYPYLKLTYVRTIDSYTHNGNVNTVEALQKYGTSRRNGAELLLDALHLNPPTIRDRTNDGTYVVNRDETEKALEKYEEIRELFNDWVNKDVSRRELLGKIYNEKYNTTIKRKYDGSHLNIAGINGIELYGHQKDAIWMLLQNNGGIIDHMVGAGKTFVMVAGTMEMKRTGVAKKPMIIALKSTIPQIVESYRSAYPMAKIIAPTEKDFTKDNRKRLFAQIANNEWDVVIMTHENYGKIPHEQKFTESFIRDEIAELEAEREELSGNRKALSGLELRIKNLQTKLAKLADRETDNTVSFQQMGIDHIMVDESQQFKNLAYVTKQRSVAGLSKAEGSSRAFNLFLGIRYLQDKLGGDKGTTFLSGTPISNSMVEMYLLLKYLRPNRMNEMGLNSFDQWATTFSSPSNDIEFTVTGEFKNKLRFREFINVPELSILYNEIADVRNDDNLTLDKPKMAGGEYSFQVVPMNADQLDYGERLIKFAKEKDGSYIGIEMTEEKKSAIMLITTTLASKMAIDMRLIDSSYDYDPNGKIGKMVDNVYNLYKETDDVKGTQLIFSDIGTPKSQSKTTLLKDYLEDELSINTDDITAIFGDVNQDNYKVKPYNNALIAKVKEVLEVTDSEVAGFMEQAQSSNSFNLYAESKKRLVEKGIPEEQIVFIHDYPTQKAKEKLFEKVNAGEIRIVLGSTQKLGTGVNAQKRIVAIHHLDVPWRPSDMEQRNGRAIRQGNEVAKNHRNNEVGIFAYATERTLDAFKYGLLQTKQKFLDQIKSGTVEERSISEGDEESGMLARIVAELSGNKDILAKSKLEQSTDRLKKSKRNFEATFHDAENKIVLSESRIPNMKENIAKTEEDVKWAEKILKFDEEGRIVINLVNGKTVTPVVGEKEIKKINEAKEKAKKEGKKYEEKPLEPTRQDYAAAMIQSVKEKTKDIPLDKEVKAFDFNDGITVIAKKTAFNERLLGEKTTTIETQLSILTPNGSKYRINYNEIPGVFLNQLQKGFNAIPDRLTSFSGQLEKLEQDLVSYKELAENKVFPQQERLDRELAELKEVNKRLASTDEAPEVESTATPELQSTNANFTAIPKPTYDKLVKRLLGVFKKFGGNVTTDWNEFKRLAEKSGVNVNDVDFNIIGEKAFKTNHTSNSDYLNLLYGKMMDTNGATRIETILQTGWYKDKDGKWKKALYGDAKLNESINFDADTTLGELLNYPELYKFYPSFKSVRVSFVDLKNGNDAEVEGNLIKIDKKNGKLTNETVLQLLGHEVQHLIQAVEGFDRGSNFDRARRILNRLVMRGGVPAGNDSQVGQAEQIISKQFGAGWKNDLRDGKINEERIIDLIYFNTSGEKEAQFAERIISGEISNDEKLALAVLARDRFGTVKSDINLFTTPNGEIYGAKFPDGTIYLNPEKVNANTPIHEFSHLWQQLMPSRFKKGVELLKNTPIGKRTFAELKTNEGYANKSDDELWNESLVTVMGNEGERIFNAPRTSKFKEWLVDLFKKLGDAFGIRDLSPNDKLSTFVKGALSEVMGTKQIIPESRVENKEVGLYLKDMTNAQLETILRGNGLIQDAVCA